MNVHGLHFHTEGTGGGCTAAVHYTGAGTVLVLTDGNLGTDYAATGEVTGALFATVADWQDSGQDPQREAFGTTVESVVAALVQA